MQGVDPVPVGFGGSYGGSGGQNSSSCVSGHLFSNTASQVSGSFYYGCISGDLTDFVHRLVLLKFRMTSHSLAPLLILRWARVAGLMARVEEEAALS